MSFRTQPQRPLAVSKDNHEPKAPETSLKKRNGFSARPRHGRKAIRSSIRQWNLRPQFPAASGVRSSKTSPHVRDATAAGFKGQVPFSMQLN
ncbi:hypothetical protein MRX96_052014 [Rhipicephalus microplus]